MKKQSWNVKNIILLTLSSIFLGTIFLFTNYIYNFISMILTPKGWSPLANDLLLGIWMMGGPLAAILTKKIFASTLGEILSSTVEAILGGQWGPSTLISGLVQGLSSEMGFFICKYKKYNLSTLSVAAVTGAIFTFIFDWFKNGYSAYPLHMLIVLFVVRLISIWFFSAFLVNKINILIIKSHILKRN